MQINLNVKLKLLKHFYVIVVLNILYTTNTLKGNCHERNITMQLINEQNIVGFILIMDFQILRYFRLWNKVCTQRTEENACMENTFVQTFIGTV